MAAGFRGIPELSGVWTAYAAAVHTVAPSKRTITVPDSQREIKIDDPTRTITVPASSRSVRIG